MKWLTITAALAALLNLSTAERPRSADEHAAVHAAVDGYLDGVAKADAALLERVWDLDQGRMVFVRARDGNETVVDVPIRDAIQRWTSRTPDPSSGRVLSINIIDGRMALAQVDMVYGPHHYVDLLSLYKVNGAWKIVNKTFVELSDEK